MAGKYHEGRYARVTKKSAPKSADGYRIPFSAKDHRGGYHYDLSILQAEFFAHSDLGSGAAASNLEEILRLQPKISAKL
jgi:hypothetical protein